MARCRIDQSLERVVVDGFGFPLGVYPVEPLEPKPGFTSAFEPADSAPGGSGSASGGGGGSEQPDMPPGEWEEWPDRYVFDILVPSKRVEPLCRSLMALLPGRVYPIVDFLGQDEWREVDPLVSYDLIGLDRFLDVLRRFSGFFFEDGLVGFGAMSEEPFVYVFVDEHKVITVRVQVDMKERVEQLLQAFDLEQVEELKSADSVTHEHRSVLEAPDDRPDLLTPEEIIEGLRDDWRLVLNIDPETNVDEEGNDLGITGWHCIVRYEEVIEKKKKDTAVEEEPEVEDDDDETDESAQKMSAASATEAFELAPARYCHAFVTAESLNSAVDLAMEALDELLQKEGKSLELPPAHPDLGESGGRRGLTSGAAGAGDESPLGPMPPEPAVVQSDRWSNADFARHVRDVTGQSPDMKAMKVWFVEWLQQ